MAQENVYAPPSKLREGQTFTFDLTAAANVEGLAKVVAVKDFDDVEESPKVVFDMPTAGGLIITFANGAVLEVSTSEWGDVRYTPPSDG
jgi:hypothetical protein